MIVNFEKSGVEIKIKSSLNEKITPKSRFKCERNIDLKWFISSCRESKSELKINNKEELKWEKRKVEVQTLVKYV